MKLTAVAELYGIDPPTLSRVLNGNKDLASMTTERVIKISKAMQMPLEQLLKTDPADLKRRFFELYEEGR